MTAALLSLLLAAAPPRDKDGHILRDRSAVRQFQREAWCPSTGKRGGKCPGYVVDHPEPLCAGGKDAPSNMQYQRADLARAKDVLELQLCGVRVSKRSVVRAWCVLGIATGDACNSEGR